MDEDKKTLLKYLGYFFLVCTIFALGIIIGTKINNQAPYSKYVITGDLKSEYNSANVNLLWETWSVLEREYIDNEKIDPQKFIHGAARGLVNSLNDPYTSFLDPKESLEYKSSNAGEYEGIGATMRQEKELTVVESPIDGSPAQKSGLLPNDVIVSVDGKSVENMNVFEVVALIRGKAGSVVKVEIYRPSDSKLYIFDITREKIDIDNIAIEDLGDGIVNMKIYRFTETDINTFNDLWDRSVEKALTYNPKAIIIDLRNNPGGFVYSVEYVLSDFFPKSTILFKEEKNNGQVVEHIVRRDGRLLDMPVVVLVNQGSASASEIFAGCMQDHNRAEIIGMPTVGKGVEQKIIKLSDGSTLQVVFQKWLTPSGKNISRENPINPDVQVKTTKEQQEKAVEILSNSIK